ncbi:hypothetical protein D1614_00220 [Maribellus luteus]|uniref:Uncharacterized protein n=1 Tax=Maribellus luteus TaxID=2305463 RepID=A0A399T6H9_9BACT|nr:hypothetical protein D1614_00220 [Maribellus luteus]
MISIISISRICPTQKQQFSKTTALIPNRKHPEINLIQIAKGIGINGSSAMEANQWASVFTAYLQ